MQTQEIINKILPFTDEDKKCLQKHMIKSRNRAVIETMIKTLATVPYCHLKINYEESHLSRNDKG